jgi:hypothetical protein
VKEACTALHGYFKASAVLLTDDDYMEIKILPRCNEK